MVKHCPSSGLLGVGGVASAAEARQVRIAFDGVGEVEDALLELAAQRAASFLRQDQAAPGYVVVEDVPVPHLQPQLLAHLHRSQAVGGVPHGVVVVQHRLRLLVDSVVEDLHVGVRLGEGVGPQACGFVNGQSEGAPPGPQGAAVVVQVRSRGAVLQTHLLLLQLVLLNVVGDGAPEPGADPRVGHQVVQREDGVGHHVGVVLQAAHPAVVGVGWVLLVEDVGKVALPADDLGLVGHESLVEAHAQVAPQEIVALVGEGGVAGEEAQRQAELHVQAVLDVRLGEALQAGQTRPVGRDSPHLAPELDL